MLAGAQAPGWAGVAPGSLSQASGAGFTRAVATDASGNVFVTGYFTGSAAFGRTLLTSVGGNDLFVAKYVPATGTWAWAQSGGGLGSDYGYGIAVSGTSVYVTGYIINTTANANGVLFGGGGTTAGTVQVNGATGTSSSDLVLAKYTDNGSSAALAWAQTGGGIGSDYGYGVALSGQNVLAAGVVTPSATFGPTTLTVPAGGTFNVLARAVDNTLTPLPVQLVAFAAQPAGPAAVRLTWTTASEVNSATFAVQRSADGVAWQELGRVAAAGSSASVRTYGYLDATAPTGTSYYRLRQVDQDGSSAYSPVRSVVLGGAGLALYPNPTAGAATLTGAAPGTAVRVLDALGRVAATATVGEDGAAALGGLAPGLYVVRVGASSVRLAVE